MATRLDRHQARVDALNQLGRGLARRAHSKCELCGAGSDDGYGALRPFEVPPTLEEGPELDRCALLCERCAGVVGGGRPGDGSTLRFLESAMWSELPAAQVCAVRLLRRLRDDGVAWAEAALDGLYLDPEVEAWVDG